MLEQTNLPEILEVGKSYSANVVKQYLEKHRSFYVGQSIFYDDDKKVKVVSAIKGQMHGYLELSTHSNMNYREVYEFKIVD